MFEVGLSCPHRFSCPHPSLSQGGRGEEIEGRGKEKANDEVSVNVGARTLGIENLKAPCRLSLCRGGFRLIAVGPAGMSDFERIGLGQILQLEEFNGVFAQQLFFLGKAQIFAVDHVFH